MLPIVQSGSTVKVSVDNLTAGKSVPASKVDITTGADALSVYIKGRSADNVSNVFFNNNADTAQYGTVFANASEFGLTSIGARPLSLGAAGTTAFQVNTTGNLVVIGAGKGIDFSANSHAAGMTSELLTWYEEGAWTPTYTGWTINPTNVFAKYTRVGRLVTLNYTGLDGISVAGASEIGGLPFTANSQQGASVAMKDLSGSAPGVTAFGTIGASATSVQSMTAATFTGLYWAFSTSYVV